ncbi:MAG TPA: hypothetical protein VI146_05940 [Nitrososphaeraceae archaeon]
MSESDKSIEQSPDVKEAIRCIKAMHDPKKGETFTALQALQQLINLKSAQEAQ